MIEAVKDVACPRLPRHCPGTLPAEQTSPPSIFYQWQRVITINTDLALGAKCLCGGVDSQAVKHCQSRKVQKHWRPFLPFASYTASRIYRQNDLQLQLFLHNTLMKNPMPICAS